MNLIDDWKKCYRLYSQQINAAGMAVGGAYVMFYDQLHDLLPGKYLAVLTVVLFAANCVVRIIKQEPKHGRKSQD